MNKEVRVIELDKKTIDLIEKIAFFIFVGFLCVFFKSATPLWLLIFFL